MRSIKCLPLVLLLLLTQAAQSQDNIESIMKESISDSEKLIHEYIAPFMKATSLGLNQGWYNTAKPHKLLGVDLTLTGAFMRIPDSQTRFRPSDLGLQVVELDASSAGSPYAPTLAGDGSEPLFRVIGTNRTFQGPGGLDLKDRIGMNGAPVPIVHLGIGLPKGTDLKVRFVPSLSLGGNGNFEMWGVGVMHDVKQYIPGLKLLPFDLAAFAGFTKMSVSYELEQDEIQGENQHAAMNMTATTIQALISKKLSVLTVYAGAGFNIAKSDLGVKGSYDLNSDGNYDDPNEIDPLTFDYNASGFRATAGFRLKLAVLTLHADYTVQEYSAISAGIGISVR